MDSKTTLTPEEENGFRNWYKTIAKQNNLPEDPDEPLDDNGDKSAVDHRKFFKRLVEDKDFSEGVQNMINHSQYNLDTGKAYKHKDGGVSTIYSTSGSDENGVEHIVPTVWDGKILEGEDIFIQARGSKKKWPTASNPDEANETADWLHKLVMRQQPKTDVGKRALKLGI